MIDKALTGIRALKGVHEVCVYHRQSLAASTFPEAQSAMLLPALQMVEQTFDAAESVGHPYEELYLLLEDSMLVLYQVEQACIIMLLTDKKVNIPLIHMGVKALAGKWLEMLANPAPAVSEPVPQPDTAKPDRPVKATPNTQRVLSELQVLLVNYLGPAGRWVFEDAVAEWQNSSGDLHRLTTLLLTEFDSETEKALFQQQASALINQ